MPLPIVELTVVEMKRRGELAQPLAIAVASKGSQSGNQTEALSSRLINADDLPEIHTMTPSAAGTHSQYYSSSRLIPMDARHTYPYSASGKIFFQDSGQNFICSGSVIDRRLVVTAGHCVHSGSGGDSGFFDNVIFVPAWHEGDAPFGMWAATWIGTTPSWAGGSGGVPNAADFAIFEVAEQEIDSEVLPIGDVVGTYGFKTDALQRNHVKIIGYPGSFDNGNIMHEVDTGDAALAENNTVLYGSDMTGGSSGGPWLQNFGERAVGQPTGVDGEMNTIVGITSYGFVSTQPKVQGSSILNDEFVELYESACERDTDNCY